MLAQDGMNGTSGAAVAAGPITILSGVLSAPVLRLWGRSCTCAEAVSELQTLLPAHENYRNPYEGGLHSPSAMAFTARLSATAISVGAKMTVRVVGPLTSSRYHWSPDRLPLVVQRQADLGDLAEKTRHHLRHLWVSCLPVELLHQLPQVVHATLSRLPIRFPESKAVLPTAGQGLASSRLVSLDLDDLDLEAGQLPRPPRQGSQTASGRPTPSALPALQIWPQVRGPDPGPLFCAVLKTWRLVGGALATACRCER